MKKLISLSLAFVIILSSLFCFMLMPVSAATVTATEGGFVTALNDGSYKAEPYYGNTFLGWYSKNKLVSSYPVITPQSDVEARFTVYNQIVDGNFEAGEKADRFELLRSDATSSIRDVPAGSPAAHGKKALYVTSDGATLSNAMQYLLKIPMTLEKNTEYIFSFSYYLDGIKNGGGDGATPGEENGTATVVFQSPGRYTDNWTPSGVLKSWSITWAPESDKNTTFTPEPWCFNGNQNSAMRITTHPNIGTGYGKWIDVCIRFNTGSDASMFTSTEDSSDFWISLGNVNDNTSGKVDNSSNFYIDNLVVAKAVDGSLGSFVSASAGGKVTKLGVQKVPAASHAYMTGGKTQNEKHDGFVSDKIKFAELATEVGTFKATADQGYDFAGWYVDDTLVSVKPTDSFYSEDNVVAVFRPKGTGAFAPDAPVVVSRSTNKITLASVAGCEYSIDGTSWQTGAVFTGLTPNTEYTFYQRVIAMDGAAASAASAATTVSTQKASGTLNTNTNTSSETASEPVSSTPAEDTASDTTSDVTNDTVSNTIITEIIEEDEPTDITPFLWIGGAVLAVGIAAIIVVLVWKTPEEKKDE